MKMASLHLLICAHVWCHHCHSLYYLYILLSSPWVWGFKAWDWKGENRQARKILLPFFFNFLKLINIFIYFISIFLKFDTWSLVMASCISNYPKAFVSNGIGPHILFSWSDFLLLFYEMFYFFNGLWATANEKKITDRSKQKEFQLNHNWVNVCHSAVLQPWLK